jgi:hypothetical protein
LAELNIVLDNAEQCNAYLEDAISILKPELSLSDFVNKENPFMMEKHGEKSFLADYERISSAHLQIGLINCYNQYLMMTGNISNVRKVILLSHDLRQCSIVQYQQALDNLERMFAVTVSKKLGQSTDDSTHRAAITTGKDKAKVRGKRSKMATKEKMTSGEFIPCKSDIASLVFLESCLKTHSLDGDNALKDGDFPRLLSNVQSGLAMVQWARGMVNDPFLLDLKSTSLLHYLQGVVHVLASKSGFDSWRVAGSRQPSTSKEIDVDISEVMSELNLSLVVEKPAVRKSRRGVRDDRKESLDDSFDEDLLMDQSSPVEKKTDKRCRSRQKLTAESSAARSKRTPASKKNTIAHTPLPSKNRANPEALEVDRELKSTKKHTRSCRKNAKSSSKPKRSEKRSILCDDSKINGDERSGQEMHSSKKKSSRALIEECNQNEHNEVKDENEEGEDVSKIQQTAQIEISALFFLSVSSLFNFRNCLIKFSIGIFKMQN